MATVVRWVVRLVAAVLAALLLETGLAGIPASLSSQVAFLSSFGEEWLIRIVALVLSFLLALVAIGPHGVQEWITWASLDNAIPPAARPTAEAEPTASVRNDAVREMHRDPRQVEEETDEEFLIRRCRELAQELYDFLTERGHGEGVEVDDPGDPRMVQRSNETVGLYRRRFEGEVLARYEVLKERGWWGDELLDPFGRNRVETVTYYGDIRVIAQRLSTIGHRL